MIKSFICAITLLCFSLCQAQETKTNDIKAWLLAYDAEYLTDFSLSIEAVMPTQLNVSFGQAKSRINISGIGSDLALKINRYQIDTPPYVANDPNQPYDASGNFIFSYRPYQYIFMSSADSRMVSDSEVLSITPDNLIASRNQNTATLREINPLGSQDSKNLIYRYLLPLGRGFSGLISTIQSSVIGNDGIAHVRAQGTLFSANAGTWNLEVDTTREYLVRHATFSRSDNERYDFVSTGTLQNAGSPLFASGELSLSRYNVKILSANYSATPDATIISEVRGRTLAEDGPKGVRSMDFRQINSEGMPSVEDSRTATTSR